MTSQQPAGSQPPEAVLQQMISGFRISQLLYVAAKLGVADYLQDGPKGVEHLAAAVGAHPRSLYRVLRALAGVGIFAETEGGEFRLTPLAAPLQIAVPHSLRDSAICYGEQIYPAYGGLLHSVQTSQPAFNHVFGMGHWEYLEQHPEAAETFNRAMTSLFSRRNAAVAAAYDFSSFRTIVDVAGGHGSLLAAILKAHPSVRGVLFDLPAVVDGAGPLLEQAGVRERCEVVGGDMFVAVPSGGDAYILSTIIHDWGDEQAVAILQNCRREMGEHAKLLLIEMIVPPGNQPSPAKFADITMMVAEGGQERTESEFRELYAAASFALTRVIPTESAYCVIEGRPV